MSDQGPADPRRASNPLFNTNTLKLGLFGLNAGDHIFTLAEDRYQADWDRSAACMKLAGDLGLEAMVSLMGWSAPQFEPFTWAAALGVVHPAPAVVSTFHIQLNHPTFVAKAAATADHVTHGRFALNVVAGSNPRTFQAFGAALPDHATRYDQAEEHLTLLRRLWSNEEAFDFEGRFYKVTKVDSRPKPIQAPYPAIMNAGTSGRGRDFAAKFADLVFTHLTEDAEQDRAMMADLKDYARKTYGRSVQIWTHGYAVIRDTQEEAEDFLRYYAVDHANKPAIEAWVKALGAAAESMSPDQMWKFHRNWAAGGGVALVGTPEQVAQRMADLSAAGLDGLLLNSIEPENMIGHLGRGVLPRLVQAGLRRGA